MTIKDSIEYFIEENADALGVVVAMLIGGPALVFLMTLATAAALRLIGVV